MRMLLFCGKTDEVLAYIASAIYGRIIVQPIKSVFFCFIDVLDQYLNGIY